MSAARTRLAVWVLGWTCASGAVFAEDVVGVIDWARKVELGTLVSGVVAEVHAEPGDLVSAGDSLVDLDRRGFRAEVNRRLAAHKHAQAVLTEAEREGERAIELYERTVLSDFERNQAMVALRRARAAAEAARADLVQARLDLERSTLKAPFDGLVLAVQAARGQTVVSELQSVPLVTLAESKVYRVRARVDAARAAAIQPGSELAATMRGRDARVIVQMVGFEPVAESPGGPQYELLATVRGDPGELLRVGEVVTLHLD